MGGVITRITVAVDGDLIRTARDLTGIAGTTELIREALQAVIERESARKLALRGGTMPGLKIVPRRRGRRF